MENNLGTLQIFSITNAEVAVKNRIDAEYYQPFYGHVVSKVSAAKYTLSKLEDVTLLITNGRTPPKDLYDEDNDSVGAIPIIKAATASGRFVDLEKVEYVKASFSGGKKAQKDDIFILSAAHQAKYVGKNVSILNATPAPDTCFVGELICVRADTKKILPEYLFGFLSSDVGYLLLNREKRGQTSHIYPDDIKGLSLPLPSLSEQAKLVAVLSKAYKEKREKDLEIEKILASIDSFVLNELGIKLAEQGAGSREQGAGSREQGAGSREQGAGSREQGVRNRGILSYKVWSDEIAGRMDPNFYHPYFKTIERAITAKSNLALGEIVGFSDETWDQKSIFIDDFPYIEISAIDLKIGDIAEVERIPLSNAPSRAKMMVRHGDILVSTTRPNRGAIARINKESNGNIASTGFAVLRTMKTDRISKEFLFVMLRSMLSLKQMEQRATGGNYPAITVEDLKQIKIVIPDHGKQEKIANSVQSSYSKIRALRAQAGEILESAQKYVEQVIIA